MAATKIAAAGVQGLLQSKEHPPTGHDDPDFAIEATMVLRAG